MNKMLTILLSLFLTLQLLDLFTTVHGISIGVVEMNELAKKLSGYKIGRYIWIKTGFIMSSIVFLWIGYKQIYKRWANSYLVILAVLCIYLGYLVTKNISVIWRAKQ